MKRISAYIDQSEYHAVLAKHNAGHHLHSDPVAMAKETAAPKFYSATGYGRRIPTRYMVWTGGRWRRVYCYCFSNSGSLYIGKIGADCTFIDIY